MQPTVSLYIASYSENSLFRRHGFANEFVDTYPSKKFCLEHWAQFFRKSDYIEIFDFVTFFLRDDACPTTLREMIADALNEPWSPYRLLEAPPTIIPAVSQQEAKALKGDLEAAFASPFAGAKVHIQAALDAVNTGDNRSVVRESIHAVESAVKDFTMEEGATLSQALKKLSSEFGTHKALSNAFDKLYAYSNDEKGIRHALVFGENDRVGFDEAIFFLSACSAFLAFLNRKSAEQKV
jgi:hypothetical protein